MMVGVVHRKRWVGEVHDFLMSSELIGRPIYCPLCRRELKGWGEGCTVLHLFCEDCGVELTLANTSVLDDKDIDSLEKELISSFYNVSSRW